MQLGEPCIVLFHRFVSLDLKNPFAFGDQYSRLKVAAWFVCHLVFNIPLHVARRAMAAAVPLPPKATAVLQRYTHFLPPAAPFGGIVGVSRHLLLPRSAEKQKTREKKSNTSSVWPPPSLLLRPLGSGLDLHFDLRVHLLSLLLLGGRGLSLGYLRSLSSLLSPGAGGGPPPPRKLAGLLLGGADIGPRPVGAPAVGALGSHMRAPVASSGPASLNGTLVVMRGVVLRADGAPGVL